jgi:hopanoid biosynthesis associated RND transporter like protein HpnN
MGKTSERIFAGCAVFCTRHRWPVIIISLLLTVLAGWYSTFLTVNTSNDGVLSPSLPFKQVEREYREAFPKEESALVIFDAATPNDADSAADNLAVRLRARPELFSDVNVPGTSPFFTDNGILYLGIDKLRGLLGTIDNSASVLGLFARDPSLRGIASLISDPNAGSGQADSPEASRLFTDLGDTAAGQAAGEDKRADWVKIFGITPPGGRPGTRRFLLMKPVLDNGSLDRAGPALTALREEMEGVKSEEAAGLKMQITGDPVLRQQELNDAFSGAVAASGFSFVLVALSLVLGIRSMRLIGVLLVTLIIGGIWTTGLATLVVGQLNLISVAFMVLFVGLGVDFGTHLGLRFLEELKRGYSFEKAMIEAMVGEAASISLSTLCAIVAFLSFVPTSYTGLAEFGVISALGMVVAFVVTFTVQPAMMAVLPPKVPSWGDREFGIGRWIKRNYRPILIVSGLVTVGALYAASYASIDVNPLNLQDPKAEPVIAYRDLAHDPKTSPYSLNVVANNVEDAHARAARLAAAPGVSHVMTAEDYLPTEQAQKLELIKATQTNLGPAFFDETTALPAPDDAELAATFATLQQSATRIAEASPAGSSAAASAAHLRDGLNQFAEKRGTSPEALHALQTAMVGSVPQIVSNLRGRLAAAKELTLADLPPDISKDWITADGRMRLQVQPKDDIGTPEGFETFASTIQAIEPKASGVPVSITEAGKAILHSFAEAIIYTTLAIGFIVILLRRRVSDVILVLAPLAVASIWTVACSAMLNLPFNFANVIVIPLLIGLGVAGSIHIVVRARELEHEPHVNGEPVDVLDTSTSMAVLVAQLNTVAAFATLAISHHRGLYSMGMLLGLAILLVVIVCLVVLPAAMIALSRRRLSRSA